VNRFFPARSGRHGEACVVLEFPYRAENQGHFGTLSSFDMVPDLRYNTRRKATRSAFSDCGN
jgi:hypothetical protein